MLEKIIASKTKVRLLRKMMEKPKVEFCLEELARATNLSTGAMFPAIGELLASRIVIFKKVGRSKLYKINERHVLYDELSALFKGESAKLAKIAKMFASEIDKAGLFSIILFGSVARGEFSERSDIDMLFLHAGEEEQIKQKVERLSYTYLDRFDVEIAPILVSKKDLKKEGQMRRFLLTVSGDGKVLWGDKKWLETL